MLDGLFGHDEAAGDEQAGPQPHLVVVDHRARERALRVAVADRRDVGDFRLDHGPAVLGVDQHGGADASPSCRSRRYTAKSTHTLLRSAIVNAAFCSPTCSPSAIWRSMMVPANGARSS